MASTAMASCPMTQKQKTVSVDLPEQEWVDKVIAYLNDEHAIEHATGLDTYERLTVKTIKNLWIT